MVQLALIFHEGLDARLRKLFLDFVAALDLIEMLRLIVQVLHLSVRSLQRCVQPQKVFGMAVCAGPRVTLIVKMIGPAAKVSP